MKETCETRTACAIAYTDLFVSLVAALSNANFDGETFRTVIEGLCMT